MSDQGWRRSLGAVLAVAWRAHRRGVVEVFALNLASPVCWLASMAGIKVLFDAAARGSRAGVVVAALLVVVVGQFTHVLGLRQWSTSIVVTERTGQLLDERLMAITGGLPGIEHHERPDYADRIGLVRQERRRIGFAAYVVALNLRLGVQLAGSLLLLVRLHPLLAALPAFAVASFVAQGRAQRITDAATVATAGPTRRRRELFDLLTTAPAAKEVRVFGLRDELLRRHERTAEEIDGAQSRAAWRSAAVQGAGRVAFALGYLGAIALVLQRAVAGMATAGDLALAITLAAAVNLQVAAAAEEFAYLRRMVGVGRHYVWLLDYAAAAEAAAAPPADPAPVPATATEGFRIDNLAFTYPGTDALVLDGVCFRIPAGRTVALVGENGSGKTTLAKLLLRLYEPGAGAVTLDGTDVGHFDVRDYRERVSAGFQDYCRFEFLARESVGTGDLPRIDDDAAVRTAFDRAGAADLAKTLPGGLDTQLGRAWEGVDLSGGEWQKVAVSRALMRDAPLLVVFDEPTAALDPFSEHLLFERVAAPGDRSTLLISHRFSTVRMANWIVVLRAGRVVEAGTHDDLVRGGGLYAELYGLQARAYQT